MKRRAALVLTLAVILGSVLALVASLLLVPLVGTFAAAAVAAPVGLLLGWRLADLTYDWVFRDRTSA